jgi:hypothetical protein
MDYDKIYKLAMFFEKRAQEKPPVDGYVKEKGRYGEILNERQLNPGGYNKPDYGKLSGLWGDDNKSDDTLVDGVVIETDSKGNPVKIDPVTGKPVKTPLRGTPSKPDYTKERLRGPWDDNESDDKESVIETDSKGNPVNKRDLGQTPNKSEKGRLEMPWHKK